MNFSKATSVLISLITITLFAGASHAGHHGEMKESMGEAKSEMQPMGVSDEMASAPSMDLVETALNAGSFTVLAEALTQAGLIETLQGDGPFTVFAPTDAAFAKIPADQLEAILADQALLTSILTYHVVAGEVLAADVVAQSTLTSLQGAELAIDVTDGVKVNTAVVGETDIVATNGVIHVIDTVLVPEAE